MARRKVLSQPLTLWSGRRREIDSYEAQQFLDSCSQVSDARKMIATAIAELGDTLDEIELSLRGRTLEEVTAKAASYYEERRQRWLQYKEDNPESNPPEPSPPTPAAAELPIPFETDTRDELLERIAAIRTAINDADDTYAALLEAIEEFDADVAELQS
jgi:hypothetical protein